MQARHVQHGQVGSAVIDLDETAGLTLYGDTGVIRADLTAAQTADLIPGVYRYDLVVTSPDDDVTRLVMGMCVVSVGVTR
jgi:hypothetical protein